MTLESSMAGSWYPDAASGIRALAGDWARSPGKEIAQPLQRPNVLILPHAGWVDSVATPLSRVGDSAAYLSGTAEAENGLRKEHGMTRDIICHNDFRWRLGY